MTCDAVRDRLLALPDPRRVPADLRTHVAGCPACTALQAALVGVESAVARLPVPNSSAAKASLLARLSTPEPIITRRPTVTRRAGLADWIAGVKWQHAAGVAAGFMIAVSAGWLLTRPEPEPKYVAAPRHELLRKEVRHVVELTKAETAGDRLTIWANMATDLGAEVNAVCQVAEIPDMDALAGLFRKAVEDGMLGQARQLPPIVPPDERAKLTGAAKKLAEAEAEANRQLAVARPQAKPVLERVARTARAGRETLDKLARGEKG